MKIVTNELRNREMKNLVHTAGAAIEHSLIVCDSLYVQFALKSLSCVFKAGFSSHKLIDFFLFFLRFHYLYTYTCVRLNVFHVG